MTEYEVSQRTEIPILLGKEVTPMGKGGHGGRGGGRGPSPNDQRSNVMNPNNPAHQDAADNRSDQMNPNNPAHDSSRGGGKGK